MSNLPGCNTRYYANYYVCKDENTGTYHRTYYAHDPDFIHTAEHFFMERQLCELFANMMVTSWYVIILSRQLMFLQIFCRTSATNCSQIYNSGFVNEYIRAFLPAVWDHRLEMTIDNVWNRFFIHSLLLDHLERNAVLQLDHKAPPQARRLQPALQARNLRMRGTGQEHWNHACELCSWVYTDENGVECKQICCAKSTILSYFVCQAAFGLLLLMASIWDAHAVVFMTVITHLTLSVTTFAQSTRVSARSMQ